MVRYSLSSDPGTGTDYHAHSKRVINKDGSFNVKKAGLGPNTRNAYQSLVKMSWARFFLVSFIFLFIVNGVFALLYTWVGIEKLGEVEERGWFNEFMYAYYFSFQTFTTVGYGIYHPIGHLANVISTIESIIGWMCFALVTGILYGRFSKPSARLMYSEKALVAPYGNGRNSLQFRIANMRNSMLMEMEATVLLSFVDKSRQNWKREFTPLLLERDHILFFPLTWTIVHPIDENSPFYNKTKEDIEKMDAELLIRIKGYDDTFAQTVHSRFSYRCDEMVWGAQYHPAFDIDNNGDIHLFFDRIHHYDKLDTSTAFSGLSN